MKNSKNTISHIKKYFVFLSFLAILFLGFVFISPSKSNAQATQCPLSGWGWSGYINPNLGFNGSNYLRDMEGMGWLSFSGTNTGAGGGSYEVVKQTNGDLTGYAWSSNVGWIRFGGLSSFPASGGNAKIVGSSVTGWARACAVFASGCSGDLDEDYYLGGWGGWISLSGTAGSGSYGVTINSSNELSGWAWGGDVVGWLSFRDTNYGVTLAPGNQCVPAGGNFNYNVSTNPVLVTPPASGTGPVPRQSSVGISLATGSSNPEDVEVISIVPHPNYLPPAGVTIDNIDEGTACLPNTSCAIDISFDVRFDGSYTSSSGNSFRLKISTDNVANGLPSPKDTDLFVTINNSSSSGDECTVSPGTALINQNITWQAPGNNLGISSPVSYEWFYEGESVSFGQGEEFETTYPILGIREAYVEICDGGGNCDFSETCQVRVVPQLIFRQQ